MVLLLDASALKFAKLNGLNYRIWVFNVWLYLESLDLFEYVDGMVVFLGVDVSVELWWKFMFGVKKVWIYVCLVIELE